MSKPRSYLALALISSVLAGTVALAGGTDREILVPEGWEGAYRFGYAPLVKVGDMVIISGVPASGEGSYEDKIRGMYVRTQELLASAGATFDDVVEITTFHLEPKDSPTFHAEFEKYMPIHREFYGEHRPAWSAVGTSALLSRTAPVEMRTVAVVGSGKTSRVVFGKDQESPEKAGGEGATKKDPGQEGQH